MPKSSDTNRSSSRSVLEEKWSPLVLEAGWVAIPSLLLEFGHELKLDAIDQTIISNIADHWWSAKSKAYPSKALLALRVGVKERTIQRRIQTMESRGLIRREARRNGSGGSGTNIYHLDGLCEALKQYAPLSRRNKRKRAAAAPNERAALESPRFEAGRRSAHLNVERDSQAEDENKSCVYDEEREFECDHADEDPDYDYVVYGGLTQQQVMDQL